MGSPNIVHRHLATWRDARPQAVTAAPELPASVTGALAAEIARAAAQARAEIEGQLLQIQTEAADLAQAGEALEVERDALLEQVAVLTRERAILAGKAAQQAADIETQAQQIAREQQAAESARVELATARLKIEAQTEKQTEQTQEIERLRAMLEVESKACIAAEQQAAVMTAKLEAMTDRATKAEARVEQSKRETKQIAHELNTAKIQVQAQQVGLDAAARELEDVRNQIMAARAEAKMATTEAAELRGRLAELTVEKPKEPAKVRAKKPDTHV